jgi:hypothetical protein
MSGKRLAITLLAVVLCVVPLLWFLRDKRGISPVPAASPGETVAHRKPAAEPTPNLLHTTLRPTPAPPSRDIELSVLRDLRERGVPVVEASGDAIRQAVLATNVTWLYHAHGGKLVVRLADGAYWSGATAESADIVNEAGRLAVAGAHIEVITE